VPPGVGEALPEAGEGGVGAGQENGAAAAEEVVQRDGEPAADEGATEVGRRVGEAEQPGGAGVLAADGEVLGVEDLGAVDDRFVWVGLVRIRKGSKG
jgi:hypothetical protein